ncbi:MAG TPA: carboxypeptidase-like regulatory domain-containing protein [Terriglobales bacterium]|nr:carboxypeptidase-like regulatory domain-containing protein [Terriglobales bacterium]
MKRIVAVAVTMVLAIALSAQNASQLRLLTGQVMDRSEAGVPNAVVYLKNTKTLAVKTFITDGNGQYRFPALSRNVDYEVYAEYQGRKSETKTLSSFDSRQTAQINLRLP